MKIICLWCQEGGVGIGPSAILDHVVNGPRGVFNFFIATHLHQKYDVFSKNCTLKFFKYRVLCVYTHVVHTYIHTSKRI